MISDRNKGIEHLVLILQCLLVTIAYWVWFSLCYHLPIDRTEIYRYLVYNEFVLLGLLVGSRPFRASSGLQAQSIEEIGRRSFRQLGGTLFYLLLYLVAARDASISRLFFFTFVPMLYVVLFGSNSLLPGWVGHLTFKRDFIQKVLLIGPKRKALEVKKWLDQNKHLGFEVAGLLTEDPEDVDLGSLPLLGHPEDLEKTLNRPGIMKVVIVEFPRGETTMRHYTNLCEAQGVRLLVVADIDQIFGHPVAVFEDRGMVFIGLREEPLEDPVNRFFKRCFDIAVSLPVVVFILPPLTLWVWLLHRMQSPGPLFFRQPREGLHNQSFAILKYRTMHVGDPANNQLPVSTADPRLFPAGVFLRKTSLDEMPQFYNVLCGEMSVVGPRPHLSSYNQEYRRICYRAYVRSFVKPGITGLAQVRGFRGTAETPTDILRRMESDIEYLENWSFGLDCRLVLRTALQMVIPPKTAV